jgi:UDP-N-acetylmuramate: L-alanyl-gamma-D-glutamyl-meso-diaminopimelate ligase
MAISAAHFYGIPLSLVQTAVAEFRGVKRRQETRGTARGVTVIDDFGHHPTAIRQTLQSLRHRFPGHRLWAIFEPRSNTTRRSVFQTELPAAFELADGVLIAQVARLEQIPQAERLNPQRVIEDLLKAGKKAFYEPGADEIVKRIVPELGDRDVVVVFSNGGFDNIHSKLLDALAE